MEKLESVKYSAALAVTSAWKGASRERLYDELGWESLNLGRWCRRLIFFYKIKNCLAPDYTRHPIPSIRDLSYNFRRCNNIGEIRARSKSFKSNFYLSCLSEWEKLGQEIRLSSYVSMLKKKVLTIIRPYPKLVFGAYDSEGISILIQLHVGLSSWKYDKFAHNFMDTLNPLCSINYGVENTEHYVLFCLAYCTIRRDLPTCVNNILHPYVFRNFSN